MKVVLINDTSSREHIGCYLVVKNTLRIAEEVGLDVIKTIKNDSASIHAELKQVFEFDCLLINGEGTMHHDRKLAMEIVECAKWCKSKNKIVVLFNTVWEGNKQLNNYLQYFDKIYCRESKSAKLIRMEGFATTVVPDIVFASTCLPYRKNSVYNANVVVIDSVRKGLSRQLAWLAVVNKYKYCVMSNNNANYIKSTFLLSMILRIFAEYKGYLFHKEFILGISNSSKVVSGRFHGTCLSLMLRKQTASISSNTHKIEGLYDDIGLNSENIIKSNKITKNKLKKQWEDCEDNMSLIKKYIDTAPERIAAMFVEIKALKNDK